MGIKAARLVIAGLSGDSGKTIVSLSLAAAIRRRGRKVIPFKKGPDYIDSAWLSAISGEVCRNLDTWLVDRDSVRDHFTRHAQYADLALIEGNRGLFDGKDVEGLHSTAELARLVQAPLIIVVDVTKATRTIAALIKGCQTFDPDLNIAGVILNKVAGKRHREIVTEAINKYCGLPVLGAIPRLGRDADIIPGRHLGLIPPAEYIIHHNVTDKLVDIAENYINIEKILSLAKNSPELDEVKPEELPEATTKTKIGYFSDSVFTFYYPENLEALQSNGVELIPLSSLNTPALPELDGLYIGGGFPETQAGQLTANDSLMASIRDAADNGLPIYAECGGLIYLCRKLYWKEESYPMAGVFPIDLEMQSKPAGHGYTELVCDMDNPFYASGEIIKGHEFHYSAPVTNPEGLSTCLKVKRGSGLAEGRDGLIYKNTLAAYTHIHAAGMTEWAKRFVRAAQTHGRERNGSGGSSMPHGCACSAG